MDFAFGQDPAAVRQARKYALQRLGGHHRREDAVLVVSELVTNVLRYADKKEGTLSIELVGGDATIRVQDGGSEGNRPRRVAPTDSGGRGLMIVSGVADSWGVDATPEGGTEVWVKFRGMGSSPGAGG